METKKLFLLCMLLAPRLAAGTVFIDEGAKAEQGEYVWQQEVDSGFRELLFSFNALMPATGYYDFYIRVHGSSWSPWAQIAFWGNNFHGSFASTNNCFTFSCDTLLTKEPCDGFAIKVCSNDGASLQNIERMYGATTVCEPMHNFPTEQLQSIELPGIVGYSQFARPHERKRDLCSPTSVSTVLSYLLKQFVPPALVASNAHDYITDIYGNWMFNIAAAYALSGGTCPCHVRRLANFLNLHALLCTNTPVVVSIQGPLMGGALPYANGHLMVVIGYDAKTHEVICLDCAFESDAQTRVRYQLDDFLAAWARRGNIAYVFTS